MVDSSATTKSQTDPDNACAQQNCSKTNHCRRLESAKTKSGIEKLPAVAAHELCIK
jgi:hypothetical protein